LKAVVVGGNGFIGSHLVDRLAALGWPTTVLDPRDRLWVPMPAAVRHVRAGLDDEAAVADALAGAEVVFHLAWAGIHESSNEDPVADVRANVLPSLGLMERAAERGVRRFVFVSSGGTVYGPAMHLPITEDHPTSPRSSYGVSKLAVERYLALAHQRHGLEPVVLRPSVAYGPGQSPRRRQGAVAVFMHRVACGLPLTIYGDGTVSRDYFFVTDLVAALVSAAATPDAAPGTYNIGGPEEVSLAALVAAIEATVGRGAVVEHAPARAFDAPRVVLDTSRARSTLGWAAETELMEGLALTWEWMRRRLERL
jgi:UDP-glucose 4-epimerase